jgi:hypothetical protein
LRVFYILVCLILYLRRYIQKTPQFATLIFVKQFDELGGPMFFLPCGGGINKLFLIKRESNLTYSPQSNFD